MIGGSLRRSRAGMLSSRSKRRLLGLSCVCGWGKDGCDAVTSADGTLVS